MTPGTSFLLKSGVAPIQANHGEGRGRTHISQTLEHRTTPASGSAGGGVGVDKRVEGEACQGCRGLGPRVDWVLLLPRESAPHQPEASAGASSSSTRRPDQAPLAASGRPSSASKDWSRALLWASPFRSSGKHIGPRTSAPSPSAPGLFGVACCVGPTREATI